MLGTIQCHDFTQFHHAFHKDVVTDSRKIGGKSKEFEKSEKLRAETAFDSVIRPQLMLSTFQCCCSEKSKFLASHNARLGFEDGNASRTHLRSYSYSQKLAGRCAERENHVTSHVPWSVSSASQRLDLSSLCSGS